MNVGRAYCFFGEKTAIAMEIYQENNYDLIDCEPSVILIHRINSLIQAMDSRILSNSLRKSSEYKVIKDFVDYLDEWHVNAKKNSYNFLTYSTYFGLKVSLKATLEIFDYLELSCNYQFLMTARLNQDNLEAATLSVLNEEGLCSEVLFNICSKLEQIESLQPVGCDLHAHGLTSSLVNFFLINRVHFICSRSNSIDNAKKEKSMLHRKSAKLI
ncbi:hypothetical protein QTP88_023503 [Uroleucon formosanum]